MKDKRNERLTTLQQKVNKRATELEAMKRETEALERKLTTKEQKLRNLQKSKLMKWLDPARVKQAIRNAAAYVLGRRNLKRLYSKTYKRKQASNDLLPYIRLLYEEGFTKKALQDLQTMYETTTNAYKKRAIAQELALYYANKATKEGARIALYYMQVAKKHEHDQTIRRQLAIIEAECYVRTNDIERAQQTLHEQLQDAPHRDLYLALANTEPTVDKRLYWLNRVVTKYNHQPIQLDQTDAPLTYAILHETTIEGESKNGPKISVILPAYNACDQIHIAIESMLNQTWQNIELLIIDDCSTDETYEVMKRYAEKDDRIHIFQTEQNSGPYVARNIGLKQATGTFVTVNDADDWSHREKLAVQANHLLTHPDVIANTSELARLTEEFDFHRRGTRGTYIFSNMSSLLFRREAVLEKIGYWDEVRFAADGEFKRRLVQTFGQAAVVDLETGPLSLPEQSSGSLTGSSAFGYAGFFMGARKAYVDSFSAYHRRAKSLYYSADQTERLFPVPEPMLPTSKRQPRHVDVLLVANFYELTDARLKRIKKQIDINEQMKQTTGLVQLYDYDTKKRTRTVNTDLRELIDGETVQEIVYGETINADVVFIHSIESLQETQQYIAQINNRITVIIIDELPKVTYNRGGQLNYKIRQTIRQSMTYFSSELRLYPLDESIRNSLETIYKRELGNNRLAADNWLIEGEQEEERYRLRLRDWLVEDHDYKL